MKITAPIIFEPLAMERVWGGHRFQTLLGKSLPHGVLIGELWEMVDRPEAQSVVHLGPLQGKTLHELWADHREEFFGKLHRNHPSERFPLLIKLLDARERLSLQVHPPVARAEELGGEAKTECWFFLHAPEGSSIFAGLKKGITRATFEEALKTGGVEETLHRIRAHTGESIFIPSGRLHAIGEGLLIVEVQQNSDTTYRVFDWNRTGLDGRPRELHVRESMASIDFEDFEPVPTPASEPIVADCPYFRVEKLAVSSPINVSKKDDFCIITCLTGELFCNGTSLKPGGFMLLPACLADPTLSPSSPDTSSLLIHLPTSP